MCANILSLAGIAEAQEAKDVKSSKIHSDIFLHSEEDKRVINEALEEWFTKEENNTPPVSIDTNDMKRLRQLMKAFYTNNFLCVERLDAEQAEALARSTAAIVEARGFKCEVYDFKEVAKLGKRMNFEYAVAKREQIWQGEMPGYVILKNVVLEDDDISAKKTLQVFKHVKSAINNLYDVVKQESVHFILIAEPGANLNYFKISQEYRETMEDIAPSYAYFDSSGNLQIGKSPADKQEEAKTLHIRKKSKVWILMVITRIGPFYFLC